MLQEDQVATLTALTQRVDTLAVSWTDASVSPPADRNVRGLITAFAIDSFLVSTRSTGFVLRYADGPQLSYTSYRRGTYEGALVGGAVFGTIGATVMVTLCLDYHSDVRDTIFCGLGGAAVLGLPAALIGAIVGGSSGKRIVYRFGGVGVKL